MNCWKGEIFLLKKQQILLQYIILCECGYNNLAEPFNLLLILSITDLALQNKAIDHARNHGFHSWLLNLLRHGRLTPDLVDSPSDPGQTLKNIKFKLI